MAYIQSLDNGRFRAWIETGSGYNRERRSQYFDTKKEAEDWVSRMVIDRNDGLITNPDKISVQNFATRWLDNHKKPNIAASTYRNYKQQLDSYLIPFFKDIMMKDINLYQIEDYFNSMRKSGSLRHNGGLSETTLNKHYITLNQICKHAAKPGIRLLKYNPVSAIEPPKQKTKEAEVMTANEYTRLLKASKDNTHIFTFILTALYTGMRRSEILGLEWEDVDLAAGVINVRKRYVNTVEGYQHELATKTDSSKRQISISEKLISVLKEYKKTHLEYRLHFGPDYYDETDFVFCKPDGSPYHPDYYNKQFNQLLSETGLSSKYKIHTLRHTFATINLRNKVDSKVVQEMLGHASESTTKDIYQHVDLEMQKDAISKMDDAINFD